MTLPAPAVDALRLAYALVTALLATVGLYYGLLAAERLVRSGNVASHCADDGLPEHPTVSVQVPVYNERHVVDRVLEAIGELEWPADRLQVQVIDDSTDDTTAVVRDAIGSLRNQGIEVQLLERDGREGYKAGATAAALEATTGEFVALFDADFVPPSDFLDRTVPAFEDGRVGCVQTRWSHLNERSSWFTRAQALALDAHFAVEQWVRSRAGSLMSFNATSCVWRRETIESVGGWSSETVAEDLDLTAAALRAGWRFEYTAGYAVPCEIPPTLSAFVRQQTRWARGSAQNVRKHLRGLLTAPTLSPWARFHSVFHVTHYLFYPLLLAWIGLHVVVVVVTEVPRWWLLAGFLGATPGPLAFLALGQRYTDRPGAGTRLIAALPLSLVGIGIAWRMSRAVLAGVVETGGQFARTPKFRLEGPRRAWRDRTYDRPLEHTVPEALLAGWCLLGAGVAISTGAPRMAGSLLFFAAAFGLVVGYARWQR